MSAQEIIAQLPKLTRPELEELDSKLHQLLQPPAAPSNVWKALLEIAGTGEGLPPDLAQQHDHYLHGTPKR